MAFSPIAGPKRCTMRGQRSNLLGTIRLSVKWNAYYTNCSTCNFAQPSKISSTRSTDISHVVRRYEGRQEDISLNIRLCCQPWAQGQLEPPSARRRHYMHIAWASGNMRGGISLNIILTRGKYSRTLSGTAYAHWPGGYLSQIQHPTPSPSPSFRAL